MTKRFEWDSALDKVYDYDKPCAGTFTSYHEWEIVDLLNDLNDENEQLKKEKKELKVQCNLLREQANEFHRGARENANRAGQLEKENNELKKQLKREETDKKRLMSYIMKYKGLSFDEIVEDFLDNSYYDNWWENGFYESCWDEYLKEKGFDGCDEE